MLRKFFPIIVAIVITFSGFLSLAPKPAHASVLSTIQGITEIIKFLQENKDKFTETDRDLREFCGKRTGNQMNLETWYSGKCKVDGKMIPESESRMGEGVGFSDIITLDFQEKIVGAKDPDSTFVDDVVNALTTIMGILTSRNPSELEQYQQRFANINKGNGVSGQIANVITKVISTPPATSTDYLSYIKSNLASHHIVTPALAAGSMPGVGFRGLSAILPYWKGIRNLAYMLFAVMFVVYGFMIMFRVKIDPKTVITLQLALPKIIITMALITFSYAIVGFLVDLMYVAFFFLFGLFVSGGSLGAGGVSEWFTNIASGNVGLFLSWLFNTLIAAITVPGAVISMIIGGPVELGLLINVGLGFFGGWILNLIVALAILFVYGKVLWTLTVAYLTVILKLIFSPIILLGNLLPGSNAVQGWVMDIVSEISVFPTTMFCFALSFAFMSQGFLGSIPGFGVGQISGYLDTPPIIGPLVGGAVDAEAAMVVIGFALLLMAPKYANMIKDALKVPPFKYGTAMGEALQWGFNYEKGMYDQYPRLPGAGQAKRVNKVVQDIATPQPKKPPLDVHVVP